MANAEDLARMNQARIPKERKTKRPIAKFSKKKLEQKEAEKKLISSHGDTFIEKWFKARRRELTGTCQCGCGQPSQKKDDIYFRYCCAHIFPKSEVDGFPSIALHPLNYVERKFWGGCHTNMDEGGMDKWPFMADWDDIKEKFYVLAALLTEEEKGKKFYTRLEKLVYEN